MRKFLLLKATYEIIASTKNSTPQFRFFTLLAIKILTKICCSFFHTANAHLEAEGVFIFDVWYGPAVLNEKPEKRTKILENKMLKVQRHATPEIHFNDNVVDVNYEILITKKSDNSQNKLNETHKMRYLFKPELELLLSNCGFEMIACEEWLNGKEASEKSWGVCFIAKKVK